MPLKVAQCSQAIYRNIVIFQSFLKSSEWIHVFSFLRYPTVSLSHSLKTTLELLHTELY